MVTERNPSGVEQTAVKVAKECIEFFGRTDITLTSVTKNTDALGKITSVTESTSTITGDLQFVSVKERQFIDLGIAVIGDGIFYTFPATSINPNDEITVDSVVWILTTQVEGEQIKGETVYQAWIAKRKSP